MVAVATQHVLSSDDVLFLKAAVSKVQQWLIFLYGADFLTPTSHWTLHIPMFVERYGTPRGYWTFPQESILSLAKKSTRKMTNHRAVSYTCVRLFVLERLLQQLLDPLAVIPKRFFFSLSKLKKKKIIIIIIRSQDLPLKEESRALWVLWALWPPFLAPLLASWTLASQSTTKPSRQTPS